MVNAKIGIICSDVNVGDESMVLQTLTTRYK